MQRGGCQCTGLHLQYLLRLSLLSNAKIEEALLYSKAELLRF